MDSAGKAGTGLATGNRVFQSKNLKIVAAAALAVVAAWLIGPSTEAQGTSITFSRHNDGSAWVAGPDFATDVLGDPWDFSNIEDVDRDPATSQNWSAFSVSGGTAGGSTSSAAVTMGILYSGYYNAINPGRNGRNLPVDTTRYQIFSFRGTASQAQGAPFLFWFHLPWGHPSDPTTGFFGDKRIASSTAAGNGIYSTDLSTGLDNGRAWTDGNVVGLRLDRHGISGSNNQTYDWARLTVRNSDPAAVLQSLNWSGGTATVRVRDASGTDYTVATNVSSVANWNYGVLPPGSYTMRVQLNSGSLLTRAFAINAPPAIQVLDPDETGGADYAATVLGNAWDMAASNDIQFTNPPSENLAPGSSFSSNQFHATNDGTTNGPNVMLLDHTNNATPIDTSTYRFLTVRYSVDGAFDLGRGSVARILWSSAPFDGNTATTSHAWLVWPGMNAYTVDLATLTTAADGGLEPGEGTPRAWQNGTKSYLNFHPHEFNWFQIQRGFHIDDIKLAAMDRTSSGGQFTIRWAGSDPDGGSPSVALYYDTDRNPSNGKTLMQSGLPMGNGSIGFAYDFVAHGVPQGNYWIYAEANDGTQAWGQYSSGQLRVSTSSSTPTSDPMMSVDTPTTQSSVGSTLTVAGWAADRGAPSGVGVDRVVAYAYPIAGYNQGVTGSPSTLGNIGVGNPRPDIGAALGSQFTNSGFSGMFNTQALGIPSGFYRIYVYAHSLIAPGDGFNNFSAPIDVFIGSTASDPVMYIDQPLNGAAVSRSQPFAVSGWAFDRGASSGTGISDVHVWAFPVSGGSSLFVWSTSSQAGSLGLSRPDVGNAYGAQFANSGYNMTVPAGRVPAGTYDFYVFTFCTLVGNSQPCQARVNRVTVTP